MENVCVRTILQENLEQQYDLAISLVNQYINSDNPDTAIQGRELELALGATVRGEPLPRRVFHLMRKMQ